LRGREDPFVQGFAFLGRQLLRIVEAARHALRIEDHGGSDHRAGERPPPGLVAAGDGEQAARHRAALAREGRPFRRVPEWKTRRGVGERSGLANHAAILTRADRSGNCVFVGLCRAGMTCPGRRFTSPGGREPAPRTRSGVDRAEQSVGG
jgi:hypothetical protein